MKVTTPFAMVGQMRVKVIWDLVPTPKRIKPFLISSRRDSYNIAIYGLLFTRRGRQVGTGRYTNE